MQSYLLILIVGFAAGAVSGVIGTGSSIILMPLLVIQFGPKEAVPIMAVAGLMANIAKVGTWFREVDWRACFAYALPGTVGAALGARTLLALDPHVIDVGLGVFFLAMIPVHHWLAMQGRQINLFWLGASGAESAS